MISYDPAERLTIKEIRAHPWMQELVASVEDVRARMTETDDWLHAKR